MTLTPKETSLLKDLKDSEQLCIDKYTKHASAAHDPQLKNLFSMLASDEQKHLETLTEIGEGKVTVRHKDGTTEEIATDSVVLSVGYVPTPVAKKGGRVHVIGDAAEVGNLRTVIWGAWDVAMKL
jgi:hypothetical protein